MKIKDIKYPKQCLYGDVPYINPNLTPYKEITVNLTRYARLISELGQGEKAQELMDKSFEELDKIAHEFEAIVQENSSSKDEPATLEEIRALRPDGPRKLIEKLPDDFHERLTGALLGRGAGCTLGAGLEFESVEDEEDWARYLGQEYPLTDYWKMIKMPYHKAWRVSPFEERTPKYMKSIPADDDTNYTLIGLLTLEKYGFDFTHKDMAELWANEYLPIRNNEGSYSCYWGERELVKNLASGMDPEKAGHYMNPNVQSLAAWTRADAWGYACAGWPEKAAEMAYKDASINHIRNGIYGEMFFAATIAASFVVDTPLEAIKIGLSEIPKDCLFAEAINWAIEISPTIKNYKQAASAVHQRYDGMFAGNSCCTATFIIFGLLIGQKDFTKVIGETVAMTYDNDCTGATAGSICGALIGKKNIPEHWYLPFNNKMDAYLNSLPRYLDIDEVVSRFEKLAKSLY